MLYAVILSYSILFVYCFYLSCSAKCNSNRSTQSPWRLLHTTGTQQLYKIFKCQMHETKAIIRLNLIVSTNKLKLNERILTDFAYQWQTNQQTAHTHKTSKFNHIRNTFKTLIPFVRPPFVSLSSAQSLHVQFIWSNSHFFEIIQSIYGTFLPNAWILQTNCIA